jgi:hypothetical protein
MSLCVCIERRLSYQNDAADASALSIFLKPARKDKAKMESSIPQEVERMRRPACSGVGDNIEGGEKATFPVSETIC